FFKNFTESLVNITINPLHVDEGLTESFTAHCTFDPLRGTLVTLTISRANDSSRVFVDLASINRFSNTSFDIISKIENYTVTSDFNATGLSRLQLRWVNPTQEQSGAYKCSAAELSDAGQITLEENAVTLTVGKPGAGQLTNKLKQMNALLKSYEERLTLLAENVLDLTKNMTVLSENYKVNADQLDRLKSMFFVESIRFNDTEYLLSRDNFGSANVLAIICNMYRGYLVEFDDAEEFDALTSLIENATEFSNVYVGGSDLMHEDQWVMESTGQNMTWSNWYPGEPDSGTGADCIRIYQIFDWQMVDTECFSHDIQYRFICEVPLKKLRLSNS
ncbi:unnamed protein product, partial [Lymnaea stagnalis]